MAFLFCAYHPVLVSFPLLVLMFAFLRAEDPFPLSGIEQPERIDFRAFFNGLSTPITPLHHTYSFFGTFPCFTFFVYTN